MDREAVDKLSRMMIKNLNGSKSHQEAIEETETFLMDRKCNSSYREGKLKSSIDSLAVRRCPVVVEIA